MEAPPPKRARGDAALVVPAPSVSDVALVPPPVGDVVLDAPSASGDQAQAEDDLDDPPRAVDRDGRVLLGAAWHAESAAVLRRHGIKAVLVVADADADMAAPADVEVHTAAIADDADADLAAVLPGALAYLAAQVKLGRTVLVASPRGYSRAPAVCAAYLMHTERLTLKDALTAVAKARPTARVNVGFFETLQCEEARVHASAQQTPSVSLGDYRRSQVRIWSGEPASSSDEDDG